MNRNETTSSLSGHSDEFLTLDFQKQTPKNEYSRSQLLELRHDDTIDMIEKAKNMKIAERIIKKNAEMKLTNAKCGGGAMGGPGKKGLIHVKCGPPASKEKPKEPNVDDFWSKATTTSSNRNAAAAAQNDDSLFNFDLANPWDKSGFDDPTEFSFQAANNAKVGSWLNTGRNEMPTQFSQCDDDFGNEPSNQSNPMFFSNERKGLNETSSLVSDASSTSAVRSRLLDKTAKLKQTLSKLKKQNPNN